MSSSLPFECEDCGATYNGRDAANGCCSAPREDSTRPRVEAFVRGKESFVLEGEGSEEWIKADEAVEVTQ